MVEIHRVWLNVDTEDNYKITLLSRPRVSIHVDEYIWNLIEENIVKPHKLMRSGKYVGLSIAYDPYMREVVQADRFTTCGGDGGCNICGGLGPFLGFLPCSPHYKPEVQEDNALDGDYDFYRPIIRVEMDG